MEFYRFKVMTITFGFEEISVIKTFFVFSPLFIGSFQGFNEQFVSVVGFGFQRGNGLIEVRQINADQFELCHFGFKLTHSALHSLDTLHGFLFFLCGRGGGLELFVKILDLVHQLRVFCGC